MALSVKRFIHEIGCPEPGNQVNVTYHATSASELCAGNGTNAAIFSNTGTLAAIVEGNEATNAGEGGICANGMDIVFVVDYTQSMSGAINGVKTGLSNLVSTINSESNGDYRLGLVIFDGETSSSPNYALSQYYINLPSGQKISQFNSTTNAYDYITCMHKMGTVGDSTAFNNALNVLAATQNSATGMVIGANKEVGGLAIEEVAGNSFAGQWRAGVQRLVILVTDAPPEMSTTYFQQTIFPIVNNNQVQVMVNSSQSSNAKYSYLSQNTQPAGADHYSLNFNSTWTTGLETSISELCNDTFLYTCDDLAIGWYIEDGQNTAYYWNGSTWSQEQECSYTVTINLSETINDATLDAIDSNHAYYQDADTLSITGPVGTTFTYTASISPDPYHQIDNITDVLVTNNTTNASTINNIIVYTDGGEGTPQAQGALADNEFRVTGTIGVGGGTVSLVARGNSSEVQYNFTVNVSADIINTQVNPTGSYTLSGDDESWSGSSTYISKTFTGSYGSQHEWAVGFSPNPSDYTLSISNSGATGTTSATTASIDNTGINGIVTMPAGNSSVTFTPNGSISQPTYTFSVTATESIAGAAISSGSGIGSGLEEYTGYTGATGNFWIHLDPEANYNEPTISGVRITGSNPNNVLDNNGAGGDMTVNQEYHQVEGSWLMPSGGGDATVEVLGTTGTPKNFGYTVTINDPYDDTASWSQTTLNGTAGDTVTASVPLSNQQADTTYTITGITDNATELTVTNTGTTINLSLVMPSGGGSATVDVTGANTVNEYSYTVTFALPENHANYGWDGEANSVQFHQQTISGYAGTSQTVTSTKSIVTDTNYSFDKITVSENSTSLSSARQTSTNGITGDGQTQVHTFVPEVTVTIPSGGGGGTVECSSGINHLSYTFVLTAATNLGSTEVVDHSCGSGDPSGVSRSDNGNGSFDITYTGNAGATRSTQIPVQANNSTDYRSEIINWAFTPNIASFLPLTEGDNYCGTDGNDYLSGTFTMPSMDVRTGITYNNADLDINDSLVALTHTFTLTSTDDIANVSVATVDATQYYYGTVGSTHNWTSLYSAASGYNFNITGVTENSSAVTVTDSTGSNIGGTITMPSGGGSATVTANGTSSLNQYAFAVTFSENISNAAIRSNGGSYVTESVTLAPGHSTDITIYVDAASGYEYTGTVSASDNSSDVTTSVTRTDTVATITATVTMPANANKAQSATVSITGNTQEIQRSLTVTYRETITGAYIAEQGSISSGSGDGSISQQTFTGPVGSKGTEWNAIIAESGYENPIVTGVTDNSSYITSGTGAGTNNADWADWKFDWEIPPTNQTAIVTVTGSVDYNCTCNFIAIQNNPSSSTSTDGSINITVNDSCIPEYTWFLNDVETNPTETGSLQYSFNNLSAGNYSVKLVDANDCEWVTLFALVAPQTTTQAPTTSSGSGSGGGYFYYDASGCDTGSMYVVRSDFEILIGGSMTTNKAGIDDVMCINGLSRSTLWEYSVIGFGDCENCEGPTP